MRSTDTVYARVYICEYGRTQQNAENGDQSWLRSPGFWVVLGVVICKTEMIQALDVGPLQSQHGTTGLFCPVRDQTGRQTDRPTDLRASQSPRRDLAVSLLSTMPTPPSSV